jgi:tartrate dehydrogenase/decarboxylase/D-malate dehydrogenase
MAGSAFKIALIEGDGTGKEVVPKGVRVLETAARKFNISYKFNVFDFASCDYYERTGQMLPDDWQEKIGGHDAIFFGAVGDPARVPDHISLWGALIKFRRDFDWYVNLRPVRLMPRIPSPLANRKPSGIDFYVVRKNTEGEYSSVGGRMFAGSEREFVVQETVMTRTGVDRILKYAFELARSRPDRHLTSATKSNRISISMPCWDERVAEMRTAYPDIRVDQFHIDILCVHLVQRPDFFDVVVASTLLGDILSDLGLACTGTIRIAPSGNINPERKYPSLFEPVHGSAPDIAGKGIANPFGQIWAGAMMLNHLGHPEAAQAIVRAIETVLERPDLSTRDMGGSAEGSGPRGAADVDAAPGDRPDRDRQHSHVARQRTGQGGGGPGTSGRSGLRPRALDRHDGRGYDDHRPAARASQMDRLSGPFRRALSSPSGDRRGVRAAASRRLGDLRPNDRAALRRRVTGLI